jgi:LysR family transcriptional activator of mexEF-oprN operon
VLVAEKPGNVPDAMKRLDTYALACLDALVTEAHVTRAAQRMGIGQPAMSEMLAGLRVL